MSAKSRNKKFPGKILWAPWRIDYILEDKEGGCLFCQKSKSKDDAKNYVIYRSERSFALLNTFPYNSGHIMVAPYRHTAEFEGLGPEETADLMQCVQKCLQALKKSMEPEGFNLGINLGKSAGAGVVDHLHIHIVPRWQGDTNYMPVIADTTIIPQSLKVVYDLLKKTFSPPT